MSTASPPRAEPAGTPPEHRRRISRGRAPAASGAVLFPALVRAHYRYFVLDAGYGEPGGVPPRYAPNGADPKPGRPRPRAEELERARADYERALADFQASEGTITDAYWCVVAPSAVALTVRPGEHVLGVLWRRQPTIRVHRATDWLTNAYADIALLLHHSDTVAIKAAEVLRGSSKHIALEWVLSEQKFLLAAAEERARRELCADEDDSPRRSRGRAAKGEGETAAGNGGGGPAGPPGGAEHPADDLIRHAQNELLQVERYYDRAGNKTARIAYFWGMVAGFLLSLGILALAALLVDATFFPLDLDDSTVRNFFVCYAAGALGAVVSVLTRMKRETGFILDYEVGRTQSFRLGGFRPFIGAVFGLLIYFALESDLLQIAVPDRDPETGASAATFPFLALLAFVAGFSERLTHVVLGRAERSIAASLGEPADDAPAGPPPARPPAAARPTGDRS